MLSSSHPPHHVNPEAGNTVALTLLGLAVAILAGVAVLYVVGKQKPMPIPVTQPIEPPAPVEPTNPRAGWNVYEDTTYSFAFEYPNGWSVATDTVFEVPVVTAYAPAQSVDASSTLGVHGLATRVSMYPHGLPEGVPSDTEVPRNLGLQVDGARSVDFVLAPSGSGRAWASLVRFSSVPTGWTEEGYVFARVQVQDERISYMRGDATISEEEYDAMLGDRTAREGFVDPLIRGVEEEILRSFRFTQDEQGELTDLIKVTAPKPGDRVSSPLTVSGSARGMWFFEGSFPIQLVTDTGVELSTVPALAQDDWMTEEFVPFTVSITFPETTATSGVLRLSRDNPSGLTEHDQSIDIPVTF